MRKIVLTSLIRLMSLQTHAAPAKVTRQSSDSSIQWASCGSAYPAKLECGHLAVPIDWSNSTSPAINLTNARVRASSNVTRIGSLFYNPGGPGGSAIETCVGFAEGIQFFSDSLASHFDIICPDPRGVGSSNPIRCDPELGNTRQTIFPSTNASYQQMVDHFRAFGQSCLDMTGDLVRFVDTVSVARDFEAIRVALGDGKFNYLGESYGSQIGTTYAELYPENIRAMAIDGILDHTASETYFTTTESETYERVLDAFFDWCANTTSCPLYGQNVSGIFDDVVTQANNNPIAAPGCLADAGGMYAGACLSNVTGEEIRLNAQGLLLFKNGTRYSNARNWDVLGQALDDAQNGNATLLSTPTSSNESFGVWQGLAVECLDWAASQNFADNRNKQLLTASTSPHTKGASQSYTIEAQCAGWPVPITNPQRPLNATAVAQTPPILMVNAYYDPSTSYTWANSIKEQVPNGVLLSRNGYGHTSYALGGEAAAAIDAYLVNGTLPAPGTVVQT